ncbi:hypothetical protein Tco_0621837, partial [Tanacetum coccineum]
LACYHRGDSEIVAAVWKGEYHGLVLCWLICHEKNSTKGDLQLPNIKVVLKRKVTSLLMLSFLRGNAYTTGTWSRNHIEAVDLITTCLADILGTRKDRTKHYNHEIVVHNIRFRNAYTTGTWSINYIEAVDPITTCLADILGTRKDRTKHYDHEIVVQTIKQRCFLENFGSATMAKNFNFENNSPTEVDKAPTKECIAQIRDMDICFVIAQVRHKLNVVVLYF